MKKILIACTAILLLAACGTKNHYSIDGVTTEPSFEGCMVYLVANDSPVDSIVITNGTFHFEGTSDETQLFNLYAINNNHSLYCSLPVVLEHGTIHADLDRDSIYGTPLNDAYNACLLKHNYKTSYKKLEQFLSEIKNADPVSRQALVEEYYKFQEEVFIPCAEETLKDLLQSNKANPLGVYAARELASNKIMESQELENLMADTNSLFAKDVLLRKLLDETRRIEATSPGHHFADFNCILPNGELGPVSQLVNGKLTLLDFWASWCAPCREEISSNLIRLSKEYAPKGLQVIGVDVWDQPDKHAAAVQQLSIPYTQVIDTTKNATDLYGISGIPQIILISPDGTILARDLRGNAIEEAILDALK